MRKSKGGTVVTSFSDEDTSVSDVNPDELARMLEVSTNTNILMQSF